MAPLREPQVGPRRQGGQQQTRESAAHAAHAATRRPTRGSGPRPSTARYVMAQGHEAQRPLYRILQVMSRLATLPASDIRPITVRSGAI